MNLTKLRARISEGDYDGIDKVTDPIVLSYVGVHLMRHILSPPLITDEGCGSSHMFGHACPNMWEEGQRSGDGWPFPIGFGRFHGGDGIGCGHANLDVGCGTGNGRLPVRFPEPLQDGHSLTSSGEYVEWGPCPMCRGRGRAGFA